MSPKGASSIFIMKSPHSKALDKGIMAKAQKEWDSNPPKGGMSFISGGKAHRFVNKKGKMHYESSSK